MNGFDDAVIQLVSEPGFVLVIITQLFLEAFQNTVSTNFRFWRSGSVGLGWGGYWESVAPLGMAGAPTFGANYTA